MDNNNGIIPITRKVDEIIVSNYVGSEYTMPQAMLFSVETSGDGYLVAFCDSSSDVYDLMESAENRKVASESEYVAVVTTGWASPLPEGQDEPDVAPSKHPERRRVRLTMVASRSDAMSLMRFQDDPDNPICEMGGGRLADSLREMFA